MPKHSYNMLCCYKQYRKSLSVIWIYEFNFFTNNKIAPLNIRIMVKQSLKLLFSHSVMSDSLQPAAWTAACQASLSITNSWSFLKLMFIELVMSSNHLIPCRPLLLLPSIWRTNFKCFNQLRCFMAWCWINYFVWSLFCYLLDVDTYLSHRVIVSNEVIHVKAYNNKQS